MRGAMGSTLLMLAAIVGTVSILLCRFISLGARAQGGELEAATASSGSAAGCPREPFLMREEVYHGIRVSGLTKTEAEDMVDWLEANGRYAGELCYVAGKGFTVSEI
jgi:hypothetical protein